MLNAVYRLVAPRRFEVEFTEIELRNVIVRPTHLSICRDIIRALVRRRFWHRNCLWR